MIFSSGSLIKARNREWVVLDSSEPDFLIARPLGGTDAEIAGFDTALETIEEASFSLPDPSLLGDYESCRRLRDAIRLGFRSSAGPFRSFGHIAVQPRSYQLVPLLMALRQDPVRLLIADDVGIGKTIESLMIVKELLDRQEIKRFSILCPPHLAEQWKKELFQKFHIEAELVLSSTASSLDRHCGNRSVFDVFPFTIVSMDYIKSESRRHDFIQACPELIIVDEAHTCTIQGQSSRGGGRQQRHYLLQQLAQDPARHVILVTATPHSGNSDGFRSLIHLLNSRFQDFPEELSGEQNRKHREELARHFVMRLRGDIRRNFPSDSIFPERLESDIDYNLTKTSDYHKLFERVLKYARERVQDARELTQIRQRVCFWAALGMLRSLASSPAAAEATFRSKLKSINASRPEEVDEFNRGNILDEDIEEISESFDIAPGAETTDEPDSDSPVNSGSERRRLLDFAHAAAQLKGDKDPKLLKTVTHVKQLLAEGHRPIIFCRFIATADYLAAELRNRLPKETEVMVVTGSTPPSERESKIQELESASKYVLVCTDCLSEGINLQHLFDAVVHYDLSWNPTRHEQRAGRVDRFGQPRETVKISTIYGIDNKIDGFVLKVLLNKHKNIRKTLGISLPAPSNTNSILESIFQGVFLTPQTSQEQLLLFDAFESAETQRKEIEQHWVNAEKREKHNRSLFAQNTIGTDEVVSEIASMQRAIGAEADVQKFVITTLSAFNATCNNRDPDFTFDIRETPSALKEAMRLDESDGFQARFKPDVKEGQRYLSRTDPIVEGLASFVLNSALDSNSPAEIRTKAARCGAIRTNKVQKRTTLLLLRFRFHIMTSYTGDPSEPPKALLAEDCRLVGFRGSPATPEWLTSEEAEALLEALPDENYPADQATESIRRIIENISHIQPELNEFARQRGKQLLDSHTRVRKASRRTGVKYEVEPHLPPDILGLFLYMPSSIQP
jgi:superfamily II DNA or RNA helicase